MFLLAVPVVTAVAGYFAKTPTTAYYYGSQYSVEIGTKANAYMKNIPLNQLGALFGTNVGDRETELNKIVEVISAQVALDGVAFEDGKQAAIRNVVVECLKPLEARGKELSSLQEEIQQRVKKEKSVDDCNKGNRRSSIFLAMEKKLKFVSRDELLNMIDERLKTSDDIVDEFTLV
jgi:NurA-like 5'-3' nuclease